MATPVICMKQHTYLINSYLKISETYRCCGSEITFDLGYLVWEENEQLAVNHAVPDTWWVGGEEQEHRSRLSLHLRTFLFSCLKQKPGCGHAIFEKHNVKKKMHEYVKRIHVHGCIAAMEYTLKV